MMSCNKHLIVIWNNFMNWNYEKLFLTANKLVVDLSHVLTQWLMSNDVWWFFFKTQNFRPKTIFLESIQMFINHRWFENLFWIPTVMPHDPLRLEFPTLKCDWLTMCNIFHHIIQNTFKLTFIALIFRFRVVQHWWQFACILKNNCWRTFCAIYLQAIASAINESFRDRFHQLSYMFMLMLILMTIIMKMVQKLLSKLSVCRKLNEQ